MRFFARWIFDKVQSTLLAKFPVVSATLGRAESIADASENANTAGVSSLAMELNKVSRAVSLQHFVRPGKAEGLCL
jgi:hypothetical protein